MNKPLKSPKKRSRRPGPLPRHMRSLQPCKCLAMRGWDSAMYPDKNCPTCKGTGSYVP